MVREVKEIPRHNGLETAPAFDPADLVSPAISVPLANIHISEHEGRLIVESTSARFDDYLSSHLSVVRPVMDQINSELRRNLPPEEATALEERLKTSSGSGLPFWFNQPFAIVMREAIVNAVESCWKAKSDLSIDVDVSLKEGNLEIMISDNGRGFDPADKKNLMTEGWSTKEHQSSPCGKGLYYSNRFVQEVMHGKFDIFDNSELGLKGSGAVIRMVFPREIPSAPELE